MNALKYHRAKPTIIERSGSKLYRNGSTSTGNDSLPANMTADTNTIAGETEANSKACETSDVAGAGKVAETSAEGPLKAEVDIKADVVADQPSAGATDEVSAAYDANSDIRSMSGALEDKAWSPRARETLKGALRFLKVYVAADEALQARHRVRIKEAAGRNRESGASNPELVAVQSCIAAANIQEQKKWSRFSCVVKVAAKRGIEPDEADHFLDTHTLNRCVAEVRAGTSNKGKGPKRVPAALKFSPTFARMLLAPEGVDAEWAKNKLSQLEAEARARPRNSGKADGEPTVR